jgi:hypothetical protein
MNGIVNGIAHVSFVGAGFFVPAGTAVERRTLIERVAGYSRTQGRVQVLTEGKRWMVQCTGNRCPAVCASCEAAIKTAACQVADEEQVYCLRCAFDDRCAAGERFQPGAGRPLTVAPRTEHRSGRRLGVCAA